MFERSLRFLATALSLIIAISFTLFALQDIDHASANSEHRIAGYTATNPSASGERDRERRHGQPREIIDDVNDMLLAPFAAITENETSGWAQRGIPAMLGLLVYGFGLGYLARFMTARGGSHSRVAGRRTA